MAMTIDINTHPYLFQEFCDKEKEKLMIEITGLFHGGCYPMGSEFNALDYAGIDRCVLSPLDLTTSRGFWMTTNEQVKEAVDRFPNRFFGFASVDPQREDVESILEKAFGELELNGLFLFPALQGFDPKGPYMDKVCEICLKYDKPILVDCGCSPYPGLSNENQRPLLWEPIVLKYPKLRVCLSRFAWPWVDEMVMMLFRYRNIYTDTSLVYLDDPRQMYDHLFNVKLGPKWIDRSFRHQVMFGSGSPGLEQIRQFKALKAFNYRPKTMDMILGENALQFMGFNKEMKWVYD